MESTKERKLEQLVRAYASWASWCSENATCQADMDRAEDKKSEIMLEIKALCRS